MAQKRGTEEVFGHGRRETDDGVIVICSRPFIDDTLECFRVKIADGERPASEHRHRTLHFCPGRDEPLHVNARAIFLKITCVFQIRRVVGQTGQVDFVSLREVLYLVEGPDLVTLVGGVRDSMGQVKNLQISDTINRMD